MKPAFLIRSLEAMDHALFGAWVKIVVVILLASPVSAEPPSLPPLKGVSVSTSVMPGPKPDLLLYRYTIHNGGDIYEVHTFEIDIRSDESRRPARLSPLINSVDINTATTEYALRENLPRGIVPVGFSGTAGNWMCGISAQVTAGCFSGGGELIKPGKSLGEFELNSYGIPGVRDVVVVPALMDRLQELYEQGVGVDTQLSLSVAADFRGKTIGPVCPPGTPLILDNFDYIIGLKHQAVDLGWIQPEDRVKLLDETLDAMRRALEGDPYSLAAVDIGKAFLEELERISCKNNNCSGNNPVSSEGYALLRFNMEFLLSEIEAGPTTGLQIMPLE